MGMQYIVESDIKKAYNTSETYSSISMTVMLSSTTLLRTYFCQSHKFERNGGQLLG
jgi:hypothetical protein